MQTIQLEATDRTPAVDFNFSTGQLRLAGEAYPEDTASFFAPLHSAVRGFLQASKEPLQFELQMQYFNSSSAKALMNLLLLLDDAAATGHRIVVQWHYFEDDETMLEFGEDFAADCQTIALQLCPHRRDD